MTFMNATYKSGKNARHLFGQTEKGTRRKRGLLLIVPEVHLRNSAVYLSISFSYATDSIQCHGSNLWQQYGTARLAPVPGRLGQ